eukprot:CAMPEP_0119538926 /NCGR_PEP_ID=MMETSP1344-20130328/51234_1 /TAXON_ID=236787 /ORGANISM="Florenciella parvula, Strain CCMP2471" /LENGTH=125 /DNA_ID=CAMNT_0007582039 /DNA_START=147 /DNA_END=521 /DNA_ORIENTATION=+
MERLGGCARVRGRRRAEAESPALARTQVGSWPRGHVRTELRLTSYTNTVEGRTQVEHEWSAHTDDESEQPTQERGGVSIAAREALSSSHCMHPRIVPLLTRVHVLYAQSALTQPPPSLSQPAHLA